MLQEIKNNGTDNVFIQRYTKLCVLGTVKTPLIIDLLDKVESWLTTISHAHISVGPARKSNRFFIKSHALILESWYIAPEKLWA